MMAVSPGHAALLTGRLNGSVDVPQRQRPPVLLAFLCLLIPLLPSYVVPFGKVLLSPALVISIAMLGLVIMRFPVVLPADRRRTVKPGVFLVLLYFLLALMAYVIVVPQIASPIGGRGIELPFTMLLACVGVALYSMTVVATTQQRTLVLGALTVGLVYLCMVGILQNYMDLDFRLLFKLPGFHEISQLGEYVNVSAVDRFDATRAFGTSDHASEYSTLAAVTVPLTIHFARYSPSTVIRGLGVVGTTVALIAVTAGASRGGLVALAAALLVYVWALKISTIVAGTIVGAVTFGAIAAVIGPSAILQNARGLWTAIKLGASMQDTSITSRVETYAGVSKVFSERPLFGLGVGRFPPGISVLDNQWAKALVEGGLVGVGALVVLTAGGIYGIAAALRSARTPRERDQAYAMGAVFVGILATSLTFDLFYFQQATLIFFLVFGLLWSGVTHSYTTTRTSYRPRHLRGSAEIRRALNKPPHRDAAPVSSS